MADITDEMLENNYLESCAKRVADWLAMHGWLTGVQRAILASLGQAIEEALEDDAPGDAQGDAQGDQSGASPAGAYPAQGLIGRQ